MKKMEKGVWGINPPEAEARAPCYTARAAVGMGIPMGIPVDVGMGTEVQSPQQSWLQLPIVTRRQRCTL